MFAFVFFGRGIVVYSESQSVHYWLEHALLLGQARQLPLLPAAFAAFLSAATPFIALGQALAREMDRHPRLVAYAWDIGGSDGRYHAVDGGTNGVASLAQAPVDLRRPEVEIDAGGLQKGEFPEGSAYRVPRLVSSQSLKDLSDDDPASAEVVLTCEQFSHRGCGGGWVTVQEVRPG